MTRHGEMRLSELRPCDLCGGAIAPIFYLVDVQVAVVDAQATNTTLGLRQALGGSMVLADAMGPGGEVRLGGPELTTRLFVCQGCHLSVGLARAAGIVSEREEAAAQKKAGAAAPQCDLPGCHGGMFCVGGAAEDRP